MKPIKAQRGLGQNVPEGDDDTSENPLRKALVSHSQRSFYHILGGPRPELRANIVYNLGFQQ